MVNFRLEWWYKVTTDKDNNTIEKILNHEKYQRYYRHILFDGAYMMIQYK